MGALAARRGVDGDAFAPAPSLHFITTDRRDLSVRVGAELAFLGGTTNEQSAISSTYASEVS
jgi:hypothetical protein